MPEKQESLRERQFVPAEQPKATAPADFPVPLPFDSEDVAEPAAAAVPAAPDQTADVEPPPATQPFQSAAAAAVDGTADSAAAAAAAAVLADVEDSADKQSDFNADFVASLIEEETEEEVSEVATRERTVHLDNMRRAQSQIQAANERLKGEENREAPWYKDILAAAEKAIAQADDVLEELPQDDEQIGEARSSLLDDYFALQRLIDTRKGRDKAPTVARAPQRSADQEARAAARELAAREAAAATPEHKRRRRREYTFIGILVVVAAGRLGLYYHQLAQEANEPAVVYGKDSEAAVADNIGGKQTNDALAKGAPIVAQVRLMQDDAGNVRAIAVAMNPNGPRPRLTYKWFRDGVQIKMGEMDMIPATDIVDGAAYKVEVTAKSGIRQSPPLMTKSLVVLRKRQKPK